MSIYREEAIDTLISCLRNTDFPVTQLTAADTIMSLQGRFNFSGKPLTREVLLKRAGVNKSSRGLVQVDEISNFSPDIEITPVKSFESPCVSIFNSLLSACQAFFLIVILLFGINRKKRRQLMIGKEKLRLF